MFSVLAAQTHVTFAANTYVIVASADAYSSISPSGNVTVTNSSPVSFTFSASPGYSINRVLVDGLQVSTTSPYTFSNVQGNHTIAVSSSINTYQIISSADSHSIINPSGTIAVNYGGSQSYTYSASASYLITSVLVDGSSVSISGNYVFSNINANHTLAIKSGIINYTIASSSDTHSTINPSGIIQVSSGNSQTFNYSANSGYAVNNVTVDGVAVPINGSYTFFNVQANHVISVTTFALTPTPSASPSPSPTAKPTPTPTPSPTPAATDIPTPPPTPEPTTIPTQPATTAIPTAQATLQPQPTIAPTPHPTPTETPKPTQQFTPIPTSTTTFSPNTITQNELVPAGAAAAATIGLIVGATVVIKKRQQSDDSLDDSNQQRI